MPVSLLASLAALALAAGGAPQQAVRDAALSASSSVPDHGVLEETLSASGGADALRDAALAALAPAPEKVVRTTRSFGTVTIDHRAHLARKAHCIDCHGPGAVTKIAFTPRIAHDRCIGCHREQKRGPMNCRECHDVKPAPLPATTLAKAPSAESGQAGQSGQAAAKSTALSSAAPAGAAVASPSAPPAAPPAGGPLAAAVSTPADLDAAVDQDRRFTRILSAGFSGSNGGGQGAAGGPAFFFTARQDGYLMSVSVEMPGRTIGLVGGGAVFRLRPRLNALALGVGGFDAVQKPSLAMMPALGGRVGIEWLGDHSTVGLSVTGLSDLAQKTDPVGGSVGGFTLSLAATVGWVVAN